MRAKPKGAKYRNLTVRSGVIYYQGGARHKLASRVLGCGPSTWLGEFVRYGRTSAMGGYDCSCIVNHPAQIGVVAVFELNRETIGAVSGNRTGQLGWRRRSEGARQFKVHVEIDGRADWRPHLGIFE